MTGFKDEFANQLRPRNSDTTAKVDYRDALYFGDKCRYWSQ